MGPEYDHEFVMSDASLSPAEKGRAPPPADAEGGEAPTVAIRGGVRRAPTVPRTRTEERARTISEHRKLWGCAVDPAICDNALKQTKLYVLLH